MLDSTSVLTPALPSPEWSESQARFLEDTWLLTLFAVLLATAFPWFVSSFNIDFAAASWALLALGATYVALTVVANLKTLGAPARRRALAVLHAVGVICVGFLWLRSGGLQNPVFLLAFVLPVVGASALSRWQPYTTAVLAVLVALGVALMQAPELRWYAGGVQSLDRWLSGLAGANGQGAAANNVFPGFYVPVSYDVVLLEVFAILILACAVAAESLGNAYGKVQEHLRVAQGEAARSQDMWTRLVLELPLPALLIEAETRRIVLTSKRLTPFWPDDEVLVGRDLFESIRFAYPERLLELIDGSGGVAAAVVVHAGEELRISKINVRHVVLEGRRLALMLLEDTTDAYCRSAALDAEEHAVVVINARGRVVTANKAASGLFPEASAGSDAQRALSRANGSAIRWWEPGLMGRRRMHVALLHRTYLTTCTAVALPGEEEALYVVAFTALLPSEAVAEYLVGAQR